MTFAKLLAQANVADINVNDFFVAVKFPPVKTDQWRKEDKVPDDVEGMLSQYIQEQLELEKDPEYMAMRNAFFERAIEEGFTVTHKKVNLSVNKKLKAKEFKVSDEEFRCSRMQFFDSLGITEEQKATNKKRRELSDAARKLRFLFED